MGKISVHFNEVFGNQYVNFYVDQTDFSFVELLYFLTVFVQPADTRPAWAEPQSQDLAKSMRF